MARLLEAWRLTRADRDFISFHRVPKRHRANLLKAIERNLQYHLKEYPAAPRRELLIASVGRTMNNFAPHFLPGGRFDTQRALNLACDHAAKTGDYGKASELLKTDARVIETNVVKWLGGYRPGSLSRELFERAFLPRLQAVEAAIGKQRFPRVKLDKFLLEKDADFFRKGRLSPHGVDEFKYIWPVFREALKRVDSHNELSM